MSERYNPFQIVRIFEQEVAKYAGAKYGVAVDTGSAALFLCCQYHRAQEVSLPRRTYVSVPCGVLHAGGRIKWDDRDWRGVYTLDPYPIVDGACRFTSGMYQPGTFHCLSFQYRKHLKIGRGGMILCDDAEAVEWFKLARFSGRHEVPLTVDRPALVGWHEFMEPERAARGLTLLSMMPDHNEDLVFEYPDCSSFGLY